MLMFLIILGAFVYTFSRAGECYYCGSRKVTQFSKYKTRALCDSCWCKGRTLKKENQNGAT